MKKIFVLISIVLFVSKSFGQGLKPVAQKIYDKKLKNVSFVQVTLFNTIDASQRQSLPDLSAVVNNFSVLECNISLIQGMISTRPENITMSIPSSSGTNIELELTRVSLYTPDFSLVTSSTNGQPVAYDGGLHYQGIIRGDDASIAAISILNNELMGMISSPSLGNFTLGKLENDALNRHILYNTKDLKAATPPTHCATPDDNGGYFQKDLKTPSFQATNCIRLYWEVNYDIYTNKGSVTNAANYVTGLFNQSAVIYTNDGIPVSLSQVFVWNTASPYTSTSTSGLLSQFQSYRNSFNGDLGHLLGYGGGGGIAAGFSGLCNSNMDNRQCYSGIHSSYSNVPTYSWSVMVVTHEQGHLMGSRHTHACVWNGNNTAIDNCAPTAGYGYEGNCSGAPTPVNGGTIMSYCHLLSNIGINFSNGFGSQPKTVIINKFNAATCLTSCTGTTCNSPTGLNTTGITTTTATLNWTAAAGASSYNIQYRIIGAANWTLITTGSLATSRALTGLTAGTNYEWQVQTICSGGSSAFTSSATFTTATPPCNVATGLSTSNITTSTARFNWSAVAGAVSYAIRYRIVGTTTWLTGTSATNSFNASGLTASSNYEWQVQTVCSGGSSSFTSSSTFTTTTPPCNAATGLSTSNITTSTATFNWTAVAGAVSYSIRYRIVGITTWTTGTSVTNSFNASGLTASSNYEWQVQTVCSGGTSAYTASATFTSSNAPCNATFSLNTTNITTTSATHNWTGVSGATSYNIQYRIIGTATWTTTNTNVITTSFNISGLIPSSDYEWQVQTVCSGGLSAFTGSATFTTLAPPCNIPSGLSTTNITTSSASFNWSAVAGAVSYNVQYRVVGTSTWSSGSSATTTYNASGLSASANYEWQVQTVCAGGNSSFTASVNFSTAAPATCNATIGLNTTNITGTSAMLNWSGISGATGYNIQYRIVGAANWTLIVTGSLATSRTLTGLTAGTNYEWQVQTVCSAGSSSFTAAVNFTTTAAPCGVPAGISAGSINPTGATLSWGTVNGAVSYTMQWKLVTAQAWTQVAGLTTNSYLLGSLAGCTAYQFQVQAVCAGSASAFSNTVSFTTTGCPINYCTSKGTNTSYEYINKVTLGSINNTSGDNKGYANFTAQSTNLAGSSINTISLTPGYYTAAYREYWNVWIDYNQNGVFTDAGEKVATGNATSSLNLSFTVPASALNGSTRMRVQMQYYFAASSSCQTFTYGEVEDYTVNITDNAQSPQNPENEPVIAVANVSGVRLYPNPSNDYINIEFESAVNNTAIESVYNLVGQKVFTNELEVAEGFNIMNIKTDQLTKGLYIFEIETNGVINRLKFMISR